MLLDVERIAPCMPGAQLQEIEGDEYRGVVKVKVGPITAQYKGAARIVEADEAARRIVLKGEGRDTRGSGQRLGHRHRACSRPTAPAPQVAVDTDLNVTGKVAQFGRGVMADVSSKLLGQFVACLESNVLSGNGSTSRPRPRLSPTPRPRPAMATVEPPTAAADARARPACPRPPRRAPLRARVACAWSTVPKPSPSISWTRPAVRSRSGSCRCWPASRCSPSSSGCSAARSAERAPRATSRRVRRGGCPVRVA